jgi:hypothetical protein
MPPPPFWIVFDVKSSLKKKACFICGGHIIRCDLNTYDLTVKTLSIHLFHIISIANKLEILCGDVGNAFISAYRNEKVWTRAGLEFGPALNGKALSSLSRHFMACPHPATEHWRAHFTETLHSLGFSSSRGDQDVWLCLHEDELGYDYISIQVDDFTIATKEPFQWMGEIQSCYIIKDIGPPKYYLGNDYFTGKDGDHYVGSSTYVCKAIKKIKSKFGKLTPEHIPAPPGDHPEDDLSPLCLADEMKVFQGLLSMAHWIVLLG